jgi:hypothetical protein
MNIKIVFAVILLLTISAGAPQLLHARWVLPVADYQDEPASPPSVQGFIESVSDNSITMKVDSRNRKTKKLVTIRLTPKTEYFFESGGYLERNELQPKQYIWVWYIIENPQKAGHPPRAAVVMLWSIDINQPVDKAIKWKPR